MHNCINKAQMEMSYSQVKTWFIVTEIGSAEERHKCIWPCYFFVDVKAKDNISQNTRVTM